jgi:hypothetical protein
LFTQELKKFLCYSKPSRQEEEVSNKKIQRRLYFVVPVDLYTSSQSLHYFLTWFTPHSSQSAKLCLQSSELGLPQPLTRKQVCPLWFWGDGHTHWRGRGWETSPNSDGGTYTVVLYTVYVLVCTLWFTRREQKYTEKAYTMFSNPWLIQ